MIRHVLIVINQFKIKPNYVNALVNKAGSMAKPAYPSE
jgi:hypothetical protein